MAKQGGIIKLQGTIGGISFYRTAFGFLVREKSSLSKERIATDPAFVRSRENSAEFGSCARSGKLLRQAIRPLLANAHDNQLVPRLTKVMTRVKNFDTISARGKRTVSGGLANPLSFLLLRGFSFNQHSMLESILLKSFEVDVANGSFTLTDFVPSRDLVFPIGATHFTLKCGWVTIDFAGGRSELKETPVYTHAIDSSNQAVLLTVTNPPTLMGTCFFLVRLEFFQEINGVQYPLLNGSCHALSIVEVT